MHGMQAGPYDVKLQAISSLVTSGALGSIDSNMAKKILEDILKLLAWCVFYYVIFKYKSE